MKHSYPRAYSSAVSILSVCALTLLTSPAAALSSMPSDMATKADISHLDHSAFDFQRAKANASGRTHIVSTSSQFASVAKIVNPGDVVIIRNGSYSGFTMNIRRHGTRTQPIIYMAETPGKVTFTGGSTLRVYSNFNIVGGFVFRNLAGQRYPVQLTAASDNRFTGNEFYSSGDHDYGRLVSVSNGAHRNRLDHNLQVGNKAFGMAVVLPRDGIDSFAYSQDTRFDHNVFKDITSTSTLVRLPLQVGQFAGRHFRSESRALIDHNDFLNIGPNPVNSKSCNEVYIANYFENIPKTTALALRSGNKKLADRNRFKNVRNAIRVAGTGHVISNNIITNSSEDGITIPRWGDFGTSTRDRTGAVLVTHNTIVDSGSNAVEIGRNWGDEGGQTATSLPFDIDIVNNALGGRAAAFIVSYGATDLVVSRNAYTSSSQLSTTARDSSPLIGSLNVDASYVPQNGSVLRYNATAVSGISRDFIDADRNSPRDIGARESGAGYTQTCKSHLVGSTYTRVWCD